MAKLVEYQGYKIVSAPFLGNDQMWRPAIFISVEDDRGLRTRTFSPEGVYASEQEADIHGITFGQRLIDGKVEGRSVADMKTTDRRAMPRLRVQFRTTFSASPTVEGTGIVLDLSSGGCRIESPVLLEPGMSLELLIYAIDSDHPIRIEAAKVQWVSGHTFGLAFFQITETDRLGRIISELKAQQAS